MENTALKSAQNTQKWCTEFSFFFIFFFIFLVQNFDNPNYHLCICIVLQISVSRTVKAAVGCRSQYPARRMAQDVCWGWIALWIWSSETSVVCHCQMHLFGFVPVLCVCNGTLQFFTGFHCGGESLSRMQSLCWNVSYRVPFLTTRKVPWFIILVDSVCPSVCYMITFKSLDVGSSYLYIRCISTE